MSKIKIENVKLWSPINIGKIKLIFLEVEASVSCNMIISQSIFVRC